MAQHLIPSISDVLLVATPVGILGFLFCLIQGLSYVFRPEVKKPRLYGLRMIGVGLLCLTPSLLTLVLLPGIG